MCHIKVLRASSCDMLVNKVFCFIAMAEGNGEVSIEEKPTVKLDSQEAKVDRTEDYAKLVEYGLDEKVAGKLDEIYKTGMFFLRLHHANFQLSAITLDS
jgi:hypothetical protein